MEDSGGMWLEEMEDSCYPFDKEFVESQLDAMSFPEHEQKKEIASTYNLIDDLGSIEKLKKLYNKFKNMTPEEFDIMIRDTLRYLDMEDESDLLNKKIEDWENFAGQNITIKMMKSSKPVKKLLGNLSEKQSNDYTKIIYVFLTIFLYLLKCPQSLILSALRAFCFCGKPHISRSIFLYFRYQAWLKSW
mgnify:CR=1 FL=1